MKILQLSTYDLAGGAEKVALSLHRAFLRIGHEAELHVGSVFGSEAGVHQIPNEVRKGSLQWIKRMASLYVGVQYTGFPGSRALAERGDTFDVVLAHNLHGSYFDTAALATLVRKVPTVLNMHDMWLLTGHCAHPFGCDRWKTGCGSCCDLNIYPAVRFDVTRNNLARKKRALSEGNVLIASPASWMLDAVRESHLASRPTLLMPNPVDTEVFHPHEKAAARSALGLPLDRFVVLFPSHVGLTNPWKDPRTLLTAVGIARYLDPYLVSFGHPETEKRDRHGQVVTTVRDDETMALYYSAADVTVQSSLVETSPLAIVEAMACGCPVIATDVGGASELLDAGRLGRLVRVKDASDLAGAIGEAASRPELVSARAQAALERIRAYHSLPTVAANWVNVMEEHASLHD